MHVTGFSPTVVKIIKFCYSLSLFTKFRKMMGILGCFLKLVHLGHKLFSGRISAELSKEVP